jgi:hypothetical protein
MAFAFIKINGYDEDLPYSIRFQDIALKVRAAFAFGRASTRVKYNQLNSG